MKKIIRLTESDLVRIVEKVISEQSEDDKKIATNLLNTSGIMYDGRTNQKMFLYTIKRIENKQKFNSVNLVLKNEQTSIEDIIGRFKSNQEILSEVCKHFESIGIKLNSCKE